MLRGASPNPIHSTLLVFFFIHIIFHIKHGEEEPYYSNTMGLNRHESRVTREGEEPASREEHGTKF